MYCSQKCRFEKDEIWKQSFSDAIKKGQQITLDKRREENRIKQIKIFLDLQKDMNKVPNKKEWFEKCKEERVSPEISRLSSPFLSWNDLKSYASSYNHKVVSVKFVGYEDVYNGTVEDYHNFFVGGWEENKLKKETGKKYLFINNMQCGEIALRNNRLL